MTFDKTKYRYLPGILILLAAIVIGMATYQDYGMAWDEPDQCNLGNVNYDYAFHGKEKEFREFTLKEYGAGFEMLLIFIERNMHIHNSIRDVMLMRHMVTHLFFLVSVFFAYLLCLHLFKKQSIAVIGMLMILLYPPIYGHSYFNTKDIPLLSITIIAFAFCYWAFNSGRPLLFLLLGISCGFMAGIRVIGILLPLMVFLLLLTDVCSAIIRKDGSRKILAGLLLFMAGFFGALYISWPFLWGNLLQNFIASYNRMSHFGWGGNVLLNGKVENSLYLPRSYFPIYFLITNPVLWLVMATVGIVWLATDVLRKPAAYLKNVPERNFLIYLGFFAVPIFMVIYVKSALYDGWRHLYFIYPSFVLLALYGINKLWQTRQRVYVAVLCGIQLVYLAYFMVAYHPLQQAYFNELVSHDREYIRKHYDFEYWGVGYLQALKYLLWKHPEGKIKLCYGAGGQPMLNNLTVLKPQDRDRFEVIDDCNQADYFITNYRWHPQDYPNPVEFKITVLNSTAVCIYRAH